MHIAAGLLNNLTAEEKEFLLKHEQMHQQFAEQDKKRKASEQSKYLFRDEAHRDEWNKACEAVIAAQLKSMRTK